MLLECYGNSIASGRTANLEADELARLELMERWSCKVEDLFGMTAFETLQIAVAWDMETIAAQDRRKMDVA